MTEYEEKAFGRDLAVRFYYQWQMAESHDDWHNVFDDFLSTVDEKAMPLSIEYAKKLSSSVLTQVSMLTTLLDGNLDRGTLKDVSIMERALLLVGAAELKNKLAPENVVINEYINLAKTYGTKENGALINGVLDGVKKSLSS